MPIEEKLENGEKEWGHEAHPQKVEGWKIEHSLLTIFVSEVNIPVDAPPMLQEHFLQILAIFWWDAYIEFETTAPGKYRRVKLHRKTLAEKERKKIAEIEITFGEDGIANMQVNPYANFEEYYFLAKGLKYADIEEEISSALLYLQWDLPALPETSKLKRIDHPKYDDIDPDDYT